MTRFEYMNLTTVWKRDEKTGDGYWEYISIEQLDALGLQGWEVVQIVYSENRNNEIIKVFLKRPF